MQSNPVLSEALLDDWHVVAQAEDIRAEQLTQVQLLGETVVLWRCGGQILAWRDRCPHRGVPLSAGWIDSNNQVVCPYHGLEFNEAGYCTRVPADPKLMTFPASAQVHSYKVQERYGLVWVALQNPQREIPWFEEWHQPGFVYFHCGPYVINTSAMRVLVVTPVEELRSIAWLGVARNYALETAHAEMRSFQDHLISQDIPMVESQRPQRLPLNLQAEYHIPADKMSIAYRQWLKQLGVKFGTC